MTTPSVVLNSGGKKKTTTFSGQNRVIVWGRGDSQKIFLIGILLFLLLRSPCKNVKPYDNPFCGFE
jgi:hypothetical protein